MCTCVRLVPLEAMPVSSLRRILSFWWKGGAWTKSKQKHCTRRMGAHSWWCIHNQFWSCDFIYKQTSYIGILVEDSSTTHRIHFVRCTWIGRLRACSLTLHCAYWSWSWLIFDLKRSSTYLPSALIHSSIWTVPGSLRPCVRVWLFFAPKKCQVGLSSRRLFETARDSTRPRTIPLVHCVWLFVLYQWPSLNLF